MLNGSNPLTVALLSASLRDEERSSDETDESVYFARLDAARPLVDGEIVIGDDNLELIIPDAGERAVWRRLHTQAILATTLLPHVFCKAADGPEIPVPVYYPAIVREYIREAGRVSARFINTVEVIGSEPR